MRSILQANRYRYTRRKWLASAILSAVMTALLGVVITQLFVRLAPQLPQSALDLLYANGYYNLGILRVSSLSDLNNLNWFEMLASSFRGGYLAMVLVIYIPVFIGGSFRSGAIQSALVRGHRRGKVLAAYAVTTAEIFAIVYFAHIASLSLFAAIIMRGSLLASPFWSCAFLILREFFAHGIFLAILLCSAFAFRRAMSTVVTLLFGIVGLPIFLNTIDVLAGGSGLLPKLWVVGFMQQLAGADVGNWAPGLIASLLTLGVFFLIAWILFISYQFDADK